MQFLTNIKQRAIEQYYGIKLTPVEIKLIADSVLQNKSLGDISTIINNNIKNTHDGVTLVQQTPDITQKIEDLGFIFTSSDVQKFNPRDGFITPAALFAIAKQRAFEQTYGIKLTPEDKLAISTKIANLLFSIKNNDVTAQDLNTQLNTVLKDIKTSADKAIADKATADKAIADKEAADKTTLYKYIGGIGGSIVFIGIIYFCYKRWNGNQPVLNQPIENQMVVPYVANMQIV